MSGTDNPPVGGERRAGPSLDPKARAALLARSDMLTIQQLAERCGIPRALLDKRHAAGKLLALSQLDKKRFRYPAWQGRLISEDASRRIFESILGLFGREHEWSAYAFFTTPVEGLACKTPVEAWRTHTGDELLRAAGRWLANDHSSD